MYSKPNGKASTFPRILPQKTAACWNMIKMHCFSWYSGSVHCHLTQIWNYSQRNTVDLGDSEWPNWRRRMTKSEEEGLLTIVTTFVSEIYFLMWFLESSCVDDSEYVPNLPAAMNIFFTTSVQSENLTFLGVRSTNPLPAASGLVKLTTPNLTLVPLHWVRPFDSLAVSESKPF